MTKKKIVYIDNLRVLLTVLVVLHHAIIVYGGSGGWYYKEQNKSLLESLLMISFNAVNQSYFMGMFFFLSALFLEGSYNKKGFNKFLSDRLIRLGIPLIAYSFILSPITNFFVAKYGHDAQYTFAQYLAGYDDWIDFGVLWFVLALLVFTTVFMIVKNIQSPVTENKIKAPSSRAIILFAVALAVISFLVRIVFPVGWTLKPLGFQLGHFPQYIALFSFGIIAARNNWLDSLPQRKGKPWAIASLLLVVIGFPCMFVIQRITHSSLDTFSGGLHWESLMYSVWEQVTGFSIFMSLMIIGSKRWNSQTFAQASFARTAYAVYIFHAIVLVSITLLLRHWMADPMVKFITAGALTLIVSYCVAWVLTKIPVVREVV